MHKRVERSQVNSTFTRADYLELLHSLQSVCPDEAARAGLYIVGGKRCTDPRAENCNMFPPDQTPADAKPGYSK